MVVVDEELARVAELPVIPETESYVSGRMQLWATRDVANKKAELADKELEVQKQKVEQAKMELEAGHEAIKVALTYVSSQSKRKAMESALKSTMENARLSVLRLEKEVDRKMETAIQLTEEADRKMETNIQLTEEATRMFEESHRMDETPMVMDFVCVICCVMLLAVWKSIDPEFGTSPCLYCDL